MKNLLKGKTLEEILSNVDKIPKEIRQDVINQGGGVSNHNLYFSILSPHPKEISRRKVIKGNNKNFWNFRNINKASE